MPWSVLLLLGMSAFGQQVQEWTLTDRWANTPQGYFKGLHRDLLLDEVGGTGALDALEYNLADRSAHLYVPEEYSDDGTWGVFLYVNAGAQGPLPEPWKEVLAERKMIYVAPHEVGNGQQTILRMGYAMDSLASVEANYAIDPDRRVIGGFSGGAAIAVMMGTGWPDVFVGTIDQCRAVMWEQHEIASMPGSVFGDGEITHLDPVGLDSLKAHRFAFLSGDRDILQNGDGTVFSNYEGILDGMGDWWGRGLRARLFDMPDQAHTTVGPHALGLALDWVLDCTDTGDFPTRFDSDHMPPHTPVATPDVAPPEACDPDDAGRGAEDAAAAGGCGCGGGGGGAWLVFLPVVWARRRERRWPSTAC